MWLSPPGCPTCDKTQNSGQNYFGHAASSVHCKSLLCEHYLHGEVHTYAAFLVGAPATKTLENAVYKIWVRKRSGIRTIKPPYASGDIALYVNKCYVISNHANFHLRTSNYSCGQGVNSSFLADGFITLSLTPPLPSPHPTQTQEKDTGALSVREQ